MLRDELAGDADELMPMVNGGLILSKLRSLMHGMVSAYIFFSLSLSVFLSPQLSSLGLSLSTEVWVEQGESGSWAVPSSFVTGSEIVKDKLVLGNAHGLNGPQRTGALV